MAKPSTDRLERGREAAASSRVSANEEDPRLDAEERDTATSLSLTAMLNAAPIAQELHANLRQIHQWNATLAIPQGKICSNQEKMTASDMVYCKVTSIRPGTCAASSCLS